MRCVANGVFLFLVLIGALQAWADDDLALMEAKAELEAFSWANLRRTDAELEPEFRRMARDVLSDLKPRQVSDLLHDLSQRPHWTLPLAEEVLATFGTRMYDDLLGDDRSRFSAWLCVETALMAAKSEDPDADRFYDRLILNDLKFDEETMSKLDGSAPGDFRPGTPFLAICLGAVEEKAIPAISRAMASTDPKTRAIGIRLAGELLVEPLLKDVEPRLRDDDPLVRFTAVSVGAALNLRFAQPLLEAFAAETDPRTRKVLVRGIAGLQSPQAYGVLEEAMRSPDPGIRRAACEGCKLGGEHCVKDLVDLLGRETQGPVFLAAVEALRESPGELSRTALETLSSADPATKPEGVVAASRTALQSLAGSMQAMQTFKPMSSAEIDWFLDQVETGEAEFDNRSFTRFQLSLDATRMPRLRQAFVSACRLPRSVDINFYEGGSPAIHLRNLMEHVYRHPDGDPRVRRRAAPEK